MNEKIEEKHRKKNQKKNRDARRGPPTRGAKKQTTTQTT